MADIGERAGNNLPKGWAWFTIDDISPVNFRDPELRELPEELLVTFLPMASVDSDKGVIETPEKKSLGEVKRGYTPFSEGDVLFAKITPCMENGKAAIAKNLLNNRGFGSTEFHTLHPSEAVISEWLFYFIRQVSFRADAKAAFKGTAGQLRVPTTFMKEYEIPLSPLPEQKRIVAKIEELFTQLDAGVEALKRAQANLKRYKASVLKAACEGRLVPTESELHPDDYEPASVLLERILKERRAKWEADLIAQGKDPSKRKYKEPAQPDVKNLPELPVGWVWVTVGQIAKAKGGKRLPKGHAYAVEETQFKYLRVTDFDNYSICQTNLRSLKPETQVEIRRYTISTEDVYISIAGSIGKVGVVPKNLDGANLTENASKITNIKGYNNKLLAYVLDSPFSQAQISRLTTSSNQPKLALFRIEKIVFPLSSKIEQYRILRRVERLLSVMHEQEKHIDVAQRRAERLRQAILKRAFEGKLVPQDPNDEPARVLLERIKDLNA